MHAAAYRFIATMVRDHELNRADYFVCELGSYDVNGSVRGLFDRCASYTGVDLRAGPGVDVVADAGLYDGEDESVNVVVTTECLEHCEHWPLILSNAYRLLKPGGVFLVTAASPARAAHGVDGNAVGAEWYGGIDPNELLEALVQFPDGGGAAVVQVNEATADVYALAIKSEDYSDVLPRSAAQNRVQGGGMDTELPRQHGTGHSLRMQVTNVANVGFSQTGAMDAFTTRVKLRGSPVDMVLAAWDVIKVLARGTGIAFQRTTLLHHVPHVDFMISEEQVCGVDTRRVVALMQAIQPGSDFPVGEHPRDAMRGRSDMGQLEVAVPVAVPAAGPYPTGTGTVHFRPEPLFKRAARGGVTRLRAELPFAISDSGWGQMEHRAALLAGTLYGHLLNLLHRFGDVGPRSVPALPRLLHVSILPQYPTAGAA